MNTGHIQSERAERTLDLTTAPAGTKILTPWGKEADRKAVTFNSIDRDFNEEDEEVWCIQYTDEDGNEWSVFCDTNLAIRA